MMKPYRLLILGHDPGSLWSSTKSKQMLTCGIRSAFESFSHVDLSSLPVRFSHTKAMQLPVVDSVLIVCYFKELTTETIGIIKEKTGVAKVITLREVAFPLSDHSFVFNSNQLTQKNTTFIPLPCFKELLRPIPKKPKTILIDHCWEDYVGTNWDWTEDIESKSYSW